jgi:hypothetical protein
MVSLCQAADAHTIPVESTQLAGLVFDITGATDAGGKEFAVSKVHAR